MINQKTALKIILGISIAGMLFSGYLSYGELVTKVCYTKILGMGATCTQVFGFPACVYGFLMYLIVFIVAVLGLKGKN
jgi:uncharacterized membrane protein